MTGKRRRVQVGVVAELPLLFPAMDLSIMAAPASAAATAANQKDLFNKHK